jgi:hypothetical protein
MNQDLATYLNVESGKLVVVVCDSVGQALYVITHIKAKLNPDHFRETFSRSIDFKNGNRVIAVEQGIGRRACHLYQIDVLLFTQTVDGTTKSEILNEQKIMQNGKVMTGTFVY